MGLALEKETRLAHTQFQRCHMWLSHMASSFYDEALVWQVAHWGLELERATQLAQICGLCLCWRKL